MLKTFVGYKGKMAAAEIGEIQFVLLARNEKQLSILWAHILKEVPLDPNGIKSAILIESNLLPEKRANKNPITTTDEQSLQNSNS